MVDPEAAFSLPAKMVQSYSGGRSGLDNRSDNISEWVQLHVRELGIVVVALLVLVVGVFTYKRVSAGTEARAEQAYFAADQALQVGDDSSAAAELARVSGQYKGTAGGTQAAMLLAQLRFNAGDYAGGLAVLDDLRSGRVRSEFRSAVEALAAAGYEGEGKYDEAAAAYQKAAESARFPADRDSYEADAARVLTAAGQADRAAEIWQGIADDPASPLSDEARVRLGELTVKPAGQG
jgi:predicted negative regulator of RcsB-dependent stress response